MTTALELARTQRRLVYVIDLGASELRTDGLVVEVATQKRLRDNSWSAPRPLPLSHADWISAPDVSDREIAQVLRRAEPEEASDSAGRPVMRYAVRSAGYDSVLRRMVESGRAFIRLAADLAPQAIGWDPGPPWDLEFTLRASGEGSGRRYELTGAFVRDGDSLRMEEPDVVVRGGLLVHQGTVHRFVDEQRFPLITVLRGGPLAALDAADALELIGELQRLPNVPRLTLPADLPVTHRHEAPVPTASFRTAADRTRVQVDLLFQYGHAQVAAHAPQEMVFDPKTSSVYHRDPGAERAAAEALIASGLRPEDGEGADASTFRTGVSRVDAAALDLTRSGWTVLFDGERVREAIGLSLDVRSGIDWFELEGTVDFGAANAGLPALLVALRRGERRVRLSDGSMGVLGDELYERLALLTATGAASGRKVRFRPSQLGVLDVLLAAMPEVRVDEALAAARLALQRFTGITPADATPGFHGTLRAYQREGLGWLHFLRHFGFGGCLADDMGLGKTVQALALLESRRAEGAGPSLVVVPNSLVFNWQQEAARFTPELRVLVHTGARRRRYTSHSPDYDLVITTYGTLRRDAPVLSSVEFDYVILDEAQAIKNPATDSAKAARLLRARHRLAMTGTPVENRLADLWSVLEFLNPGMLGGGAGGGIISRALAAGNTADGEGSEVRELLARIVRPYVLRRTKEQVAPELPEKLEQTVLVDLSGEERRLYDELRDHYRRSLLRDLGTDGMVRSRMHVLEALLRLRQASCHPGLIDPGRLADSSSKLDVLALQIEEAAAEGHKVLVFSQFTSLLAIVRQRLEAEGITYEYLDGKTTDRQARVERFQSDPGCPVFLISLRAGGQGLNLTAADYVVLLDPWWNPAVEAQAIDRTHRIGQTRRVFATRLIARDTVEEKVLQLQERKRDLADAIIRADEGPVASLTREDLELLLS